MRFIRRLRKDTPVVYFFQTNPGVKLLLADRNKYFTFSVFRCFPLIFLLLVPSANGKTAEVEFESETVFRLMERTIRENGADTAKKIVPIYEYFRLDTGQLLEREQDLSFHAYGWARHDLNSSGFYADNPEGELLYGYLQYSGLIRNFYLRLGRQYIPGYTADEGLDGLFVNSDISPFLAVEAFAGQSVSLASVGGRSGDFTAGGRLKSHLENHYSLGLYYRFASDDGVKDEEEAGFDLSLIFLDNFSVSGRSEWNLITNGVNEHSYQALFTISKLQIRPFIDYFKYRNILSPKVNNASPFRFLVNSNEIITSLGADISYLLYEKISFGAKAILYDYKIRQETARYVSGLSAWRYRELSEAGLELGFMNSPALEDGYILGRVYIYHDLSGKFLTADMVYTRYERGVRRKDYSFFASVGGGIKLFKDRIEVRASLDYSSDPFFDNDFRGLVSVKYNFKTGEETE